MKEYECELIHCEHGEEYQEYFYANSMPSGKPTRVPSGMAVGVEITMNGETTFYLLDGIKYP